MRRRASWSSRGGAGSSPGRTVPGQGASWCRRSATSRPARCSQLYYEDQKKEAKTRTADFLKFRAPKYLGYFEKVLERNKAGDGHLIGKRLSHPDLSLFQIVSGLRYAFPKAMRKLEKKHPHCVAVHDKVAANRRIKAYLASERRIPFNEMGVFRQYKELDAKR